MQYKYNWFKPYKDLSKKDFFPKDLMMKKTMGKYTLNLENNLKKILKVKHVILTTSGTSALMMAFLALEKKKIICTNLTWIATINPSLILGSEIFLVDTEKKSQKVDFKKLNSLIKKIKPDVVILVHLSGEIVINKEFLDLKKKYAFKVIEDAAQGLFNKYDDGDYCGTKFEIGCFSLSITKIINMVYGGFCVTNSDKIAEKLRTIRNNGVNARPEYAKFELPTSKGLNLKPSDIHSYVGLQSLKKKKIIIEKVKKIYELYEKRLKNKKIKLINKKSKALSIYPSVIIDNVKKFTYYCNKHKIQIHYGLRCLSQSSELKASEKNFPNSIYLSKNLIRLPCGPGYDLNDIKKITNVLNKY